MLTLNETIEFKNPETEEIISGVVADIDSTFVVIDEINDQRNIYPMDLVLNNLTQG